MTSRGCSRLWLAEAVRDGRVKGAEAASFVRHASSCADCAAEVIALGELTALLRQRTRAPSPLLIRRRRQRLIEQLDALTHRAPRPWWWSRAAVTGLVVLSLLVASGSWLRHRTVVAVPEAVGAIVEVRPEPGARWAETKGRDLHRVELMDGEIGLRIERLSARTRVSIAVPDGSIEDFGTTLSVRVADGHTREVVVERGEVALRLEGRPELRLSAGQSWSSAPAAPVSPPEPEPANILSAAAAPPASSRPPPAVGANRVRAAAKPVRKAVSTRETSRSIEMTNGNLEDGAYVTILDLLRSGKTSEAREAARDYLLRYPKGFRRVEVRQVAGVVEGE